ncbi:MAG: ATP-binding protein [Terriglobia bacterium]
MTQSAPRFNLRLQDALVAILFGAMVVLAHNWLEQTALAALATVQLIEGRVAWFDTPLGRTTAVLAQLAICFLLLGWTATISSEYYPVLLLPVVSAASYLGLAGTVATSFAFIAVYLSFLLPAFVDWSRFILDADSIHTLEIRCISLAVAALVVNSLGEARRSESVRYRRTAEQLALANRSLLDAEAAVRRSERLAALGQLSAGLAHELRNPLASIKGSADLLARSGIRDDAMARELAGIISEEVDRTNSLVTRFLDFARPLEPRREKVDVTSIVDRAATHAKVAIIRNYSPDVPPLSIDPALMEQVFINLLTNAAQASPPNAPITVLTRASGNEAEVSVIDRGCGIPASTIETIFNPFVTTKQSGVGLGLAIVAKIVDGHGGRMAVESEPGKGSIFRVYLPVHP